MQTHGNAYYLYLTHFPFKLTFDYYMHVDTKDKQFKPHLKLI